MIYLRYNMIKYKMLYLIRNVTKKGTIKNYIYKYIILYYYTIFYPSANMSQVHALFVSITVSESYTWQPLRKLPSLHVTSFNNS